MNIEHFKMSWLSLILIISSFRPADLARCLPAVGKVCDGDSSCPNMEKCFTDLDETPDSSFNYCCDMFCPTTKLVTFLSNGDGGYVHKMSDDVPKNLFYKDAATSMACPFPYSATTIRFQHDLPKDFSVNGTTELQTCKMNGECGTGYYCGYSANPVLREGYQEFIIGAHFDESLRGEPLAFCYKNPQVDEPFKIQYNRGIGLPLCNNHSECDSGICYKLHSEKYLRKNEDEFASGVCVEASICRDTWDPKFYDTGSLTTNGNFCKHSSDCAGIKDADTHSSHCISFEHNNTGNGSLCCFEVAKCKIGRVNPKKTPCNTTIDCNTAHNDRWFDWCGQKGFCCYEIGYNMSHYCPDGVTLPFIEPKCTDSCENGTCINGYCCPGLNVTNGVAELARNPYITKKQCDPSQPLHEYFLYSYCSSDGFVVVIGTHDAFGEPLNRGRQVYCTRNETCMKFGYPLCIQEGNGVSGCYRDPFKLISKTPESYDYWTLSLYVSSIFIVFAIIGMFVACHMPSVPFEDLLTTSGISFCTYIKCLLFYDFAYPIIKSREANLLMRKFPKKHGTMNIPAVRIPKDYDLPRSTIYLSTCFSKP